MADKDQTDKPLKDEILPPEDTAPLIAQETVQTEETVEGELSPMGEIITEITDLLAALPGDCAEIKHGIEECLIGVHLEFEDVVSRESIARRQIATLKRSLRQEKEQAKLLRHKIFVGGSDNNYQDIEDGTLDLPDDDIDEEEETPKARKGKQKRKMPKDIKTIEIKHYPEQTHCPCGGELKEIGHWISTLLRVIPEHYVWEKHIYFRCACNRSAACKEHKPVSAHAEGFIGRRRTITPRTVVEAVCQKFYEHSTHYRQRRRLDNAGFNVARQTLSRNATHIAGFLEPVCDEIWRHVTSGHAAHMDETPLRTQAKGGCETTWLWGLCRDERGWNKEAEPAVYFEHDASRGGHVAERMLEGALIDTLQIDGWKAYNRIRRVPGQNDGVEIARCMAHARRKFTDSQKAAPSTLAKRVIKGLKAVYEVEERVYGCPPEERQALRLAEALPVLEKIRADLLRVQPDLAKGSLKTAVNYFLSGWEDLTRYVYDGRLAIDNNPVERCMRGIALSKKNSLFAGNLMAAKNWAIFYSLIETARLNGVDPFRYLSWVIDQIEKGRELTDYSQLMPWHYKAANEAPSQGKAA
ncbi:IS66 family transposase [Rhodobacter capsulatus]|nr:IS66 family transposase [Rhodobacter capsulatus]KQB15318.1 hypothetical protein AP073_14730 [Rhodobacter capsulatus]KQB16128.1 hypothetical protein AP071_13235 [Rhodobacter capsulatus]PZX25559.1 transposase IS66-like protein [Rhodobacter capsulatus]QNR63869.1 IS66 family transposase [Rhodobacter capsulatus]